MTQRRPLTTGAAFAALAILYIGVNMIAFFIALTAYAFGAERVPNLAYLVPGIYVAAWAMEDPDTVRSELTR